MHYRGRGLENLRDARGIESHGEEGGKEGIGH